MNEEALFKLIRARWFFKDYCPQVGNFYHKIRKQSGNKKPIDFTDEDKKHIKEAAKKLASELRALEF